MRYRIDKSDLFINNKLQPEGSEIELTKDQTKGIESFLIPIESERHTERSRSISEDSSSVKKQTKTKSSVASAKEEKGNKK